MNTPLISFIIVSFNTAPLTFAAVKSIHDYCTETFEIIIIDNASTDDTVKQIKAAYPDTEFILNDHNTGFPIANNQGIRQSRGDYIMLLNSDAALKDKQTISTLIKTQTQTNAGIIVPKLLNPDGTDQGSIFHFPTIQRAFNQFWLQQADTFSKYTPDTDTPIPVEVASMAAMLIPRSTIDRIGLLDEGYFMYFEDFEYCRRAHRAGLSVIFTPQALVIHHHGSSGQNLADPDQQWKRLIPSSKRYHGPLKHHLLNTIIWSGKKIHQI